MRPGCVTSHDTTRLAKRRKELLQAQIGLSAMLGLSTIESDTYHHANCMRPSRRKKVLFPGQKPVQDLGCIFFFICSHWRASSLSNPKEPTPTPNSSQCPDQGYCIIHRWPFFTSTARDSASSQPSLPSCPFLEPFNTSVIGEKKRKQKTNYIHLHTHTRMQY